MTAQTWATLFTNHLYGIMPTCVVSFSGAGPGPEFDCEREALEDDDKCILHSEDSEKNDEAFEGALKEHQEKYSSDYRKIVFPGRVDFFGVTFTTKAYFTRAIFRGEADFRFASFAAGVDFWNATFTKKAHFQDSIFVHDGRFDGSVFKEEADFFHATFRQTASFTDVVFKKETRFSNAVLEGAYFNDAVFMGQVDFYNVRFGDRLLLGSVFSDAKFNKDVHFSSSTFKHQTFFHNTLFKKKVYFKSASFEELNCIGTTFKDKALFATLGTGIDPTPQFSVPQFSDARFVDCFFRGEVTFAGRNESSPIFGHGKISFENVTLGQNGSLQFRYADLSRCRFLRTDLRNVEFTGVKWCDDFAVEEWFSLGWLKGKEWFRRVGLYDEVVEDRKRRSLFDVVQTTVERMGSPDGPHWTLFEVEKDVEEDPKEEEEEERWREVERLYRQLKRNYEERGDFPRGGDFHIGEKEARRKGSETSTPLKFLLYMYRTFSKYGERAIPAAISLLVVVLGCAGLYSLFDAQLVDEATGTGLGIADPGPLTFSESLRVSLEASFYPVRPIGFEGLGTYILSVVQRLLSPVLIALLALALRQRVKR